MTSIHRRKMAFGIDAILVIGVILLATLLRAYRLDVLPPALYWDEAFDALDALRLVHTNSHPIFFDGNFGREPLNIYLQAIGIFFFGAYEWVARLVPALIGIVTVPVVYRAGMLLFATEKYAKEISMLAAGLLAVSFWHLELSRTSLRIVPFPLLVTITACLFYQAWQSRRLFYFVLSGATLGLTLYTYLSARLFPFVFIGFIFLVVLLARVSPRYVSGAQVRRAVFGLGIMLIVMLLVFAPLGIYFIQRPGAFFIRTTLVSIFSEDTTLAMRLLRNTIATVRMFIDQGDSTPYYNLPGRPALDWITAIGFWIGLAITLVRSRFRPVNVFLLVWLGICLVPTILSDQAPNFLRTSGALPPALLISARGLTWLWGRFASRINYVLPMMGIIALSGMLTFNDYFNIWGPSKIVYQEFEVAKRTVLQSAQLLMGSTNVIIPFSLYTHPQAEFYWGPRFAIAEPLTDASEVHQAVWFAMGQDERTFVVLHKDGRALVPRPLDNQQFERLKDLMKGSSGLVNLFGQTIANQLQIQDASVLLSNLIPAHALKVDFDGKIRLWGYDIEPSQAAPGDKIRITYYWQSLVDQELDYRIQTVLFDANHQVWGKHSDAPHQGHAPTNFWRRGQIVLDSFELQIPASVHSGKYRLEVKVINLASTDAPLTTSESEEQLYLDPFIIDPRPPNVNAIPHPLGLGMGKPQVMTLLGYDIAPSSGKRGESIPITLYWRSDSLTNIDYSVFLHLLDANGTILAQQDGSPQNGNAPTSWWVTGDVIGDTHELPVPAEIPSGRYTIAVGVYDPATGTRLAIPDKNQQQIMDNAMLLPLVIEDP